MTTLLVYVSFYTRDGMRGIDKRPYLCRTTNKGIIKFRLEFFKNLDETDALMLATPDDNETVLNSISIPEFME